MHFFIRLVSIFLLTAPLTSHAAEMPETSYFSGRWGVVAFNNEGDMMKMAGVARGYCGLPYTITNKGNGILRMYVEKTLTDVKIINEGGKFYIVPIEETNGVYKGAREVNVVNNNTFTLEYLENDLNALYGRNVFVRCGR